METTETPVGIMATSNAPASYPIEWMVEPYLHCEDGYLYNPLTDKTLGIQEVGYHELRSVLDKEVAVAQVISLDLQLKLAEAGWLVPPSPRLDQRFRLKYVSLEAHTVCNQSCFFCPVSVAPREAHFMPSEQYRDIVHQLADYRDTIEAVFMLSYNEPTLDRRFVEQVALLKANGLPPAINTNATGLTPQRVDALLEMGGVRYLSVNLSTLSASRYEHDRGKDQLDLVLRNLDYLKDLPVADQMDVAVLGTGDLTHKFEFWRISHHFRGSRLQVKFFKVMDRAGFLDVGLKVVSTSVRLCGCENVGSRPLQHLHITPHGQCVMCCQDYQARHLVGDLNRQTVAEVLVGPEMAQVRRWTYGLDDAPADFLCRRCIFARIR